MIHSSKKLQSCIEAVLLIAMKGGSHPVSSKELCSLLGEKERYLEPILQNLVHHQILRSIRGPKGGYVLMRERRKITLGEITAVVCNSAETASSSRHPAFNALWEELDTLVMERLKAITLDNVCKNVRFPDSSNDCKDEDFTI